MARLGSIFALCACAMVLAAPARAASAHADRPSDLPPELVETRGGPDILRLTVDKARLARLPERTQTLVVGQPGVADVTLLKSGGLGVMTGKSFGETNLIALDADGVTLGEWVLRVGAPRPDLVVQNGVNRESYICAPVCLPMVDLADAKTISGDRAAAVAAHQAFSTGR